MDRLFGRAKPKQPEPTLTDVIANVSIRIDCSFLNRAIQRFVAEFTTIQAANNRQCINRVLADRWTG